MTDERVSIRVRLDADLHARLTEEAQNPDKTKTGLVRTALLTMDQPSRDHAARCRLRTKPEGLLSVEIPTWHAERLREAVRKSSSDSTKVLHYALRGLWDLLPDLSGSTVDQAGSLPAPRQRDCAEAVRDWLRTERVIFYAPEPFRFVIPTGSEDEGVEPSVATAIHVQVEKDGTLRGGQGPDAGAWTSQGHGDPKESVRRLLCPHVRLSDPVTLLEGLLHDEFGAGACTVGPHPLDLMGVTVASAAGGQSVEFLLGEDDYSVSLHPIRLHKSHKADAAIWVPSGSIGALHEFLRHVKPWLLAESAEEIAESSTTLVKWLWKNYPQGFPKEDEQ